MKRIWSLLLAMILILSMTACSKEESIMIQDTEMGKLEHQAVDVLGVTYDLFDKGYASIVNILHSGAELTEKVSYDGKEYTVIAIGFARDPGNDEWMQSSIFKDYLNPQNNSPELLVVPESIKYIGAQALWGCSAKEIILPSQIKTLAGRIFENCRNLESVEFPENLEYLSASGMFSSCYSLKSIELPEGCEHPSIDILSGTFLDCYALESAVIPGDYKRIENLVFWNCNELVDVDAELWKERVTETIKRNQALHDFGVQIIAGSN